MTKQIRPGPEGPPQEGLLESRLGSLGSVIRNLPEHREFLSLITSLEAMFNVGETELKYRIARSMAVLLGEDIEDSDEIFDAIKKAYDIRSRLIHTGNTDRLKELWIWSLRGKVNRALHKLVELDLDKTAVSELLTRLPFGVAGDITAASVSGHRSAKPVRR